MKRRAVSPNTEDSPFWKTNKRIKTAKTNWVDIFATPHYGLNLVKKIDADGHATVKKVVF